MTTRKPVKLFLGMLAHETNTFSPVPTGRRNFEQAVFYRLGDELDGNQVAHFPAYSDILDIAKQRGDTLLCGLAAWTQPSGPTSRAGYESLREELLDGLRASGEIDGVLLVLHGAMVAEGYHDCEGDLLARVRQIVGPSVPIGALLDLHGNVSDAMIASGAILVACKEYPHIDYPARAKELYGIMLDVIAGGVMPTCHFQSLPMLGLFGTTEQPMSGFVKRLSMLEGKNGILSISAMHGFPWSDTEHTCASIIVVSDDSKEDRTQILASSLAAELFELRERATVTRYDVSDALDVCGRLATPDGPVILADSSDNPGGGAACDSTFILREMLKRKVEDAAVGMIWDPQAAILAADAGVGSTLQIRIGGKTGPLSGMPVDIEATVLAVRDNATQRGLGGKVRDPLGLAVALKTGSIVIIVNSIRQQVFSPDCFTELGIEIHAKRLVVVKSSQHFRAAFDPIASTTVYCNAPGSLDINLSALSYKFLRRPIWPLDQMSAG
ncbi:PF07364 family protein [Caballeronia udeis]|uniref:Microcystinase C n=1 Tax=Caballeronia udeis TaxID=1232866 RepID=A0A158IDE3_9BURK|nr:M81 family metallopeptidase [Caballeronia udeis]SAL54423.1 PF07364 family protein [Caballeronia udeis]